MLREPQFGTRVGEPHESLSVSGDDAREETEAL